MQSNLNITGTTGINNATWDIHWNNVQVTTGSVTGTNVTTPATIDNLKTTVNYNITLSKPGDYYEFTVDAVNSGTIDGMIDTISSKLNNVEITTLPNYLNYSVTYSDGAELQANQELKTGTTETYKVRVEYKKDISSTDLPGTEQTLNLSFTVTYKQADEDAVPVVNPISFSTDSWSTIVSAVKRGKTENYNVGDTKTVNMGSLGTHTLRIANMSTPAECSQEGFSQTACGFVLEFADIITTHNMNSTDTNSGGWPASEMRTYVNNTIYNTLPLELKNVIIDTTVISGHGSITGEMNFTSIDKLYLLSTHEVWEDTDGNTNSGIDRHDAAYNQTRQLDYYKNAGVTTSNYSGAIKQNNGSNSKWWLRSANAINYNSFYIVIEYGWSRYDSSVITGVSPAFRIG